MRERIKALTKAPYSEFMTPTGKRFILHPECWMCHRNDALAQAIADEVGE